MMKRQFVFLSISLLVISSCRDSGISPNVESGIQGKVYSIATPGPTPIDWTPPPLEAVSTIVVLDVNKTAVTEILTDDKGRFRASLPPGTYYFRVKESRIPAETGPYVVRPGEILAVVAHYDNGMR